MSIFQQNSQRLLRRRSNLSFLTPTIGMQCSEEAACHTRKRIETFFQRNQLAWACADHLSAFWTFTGSRSRNHQWTEIWEPEKGRCGSLPRLLARTRSIRRSRRVCGVSCERPSATLDLVVWSLFTYDFLLVHIHQYNYHYAFCQRNHQNLKIEVEYWFAVLLGWTYNWYQNMWVSNQGCVHAWYSKYFNALFIKI